MEAWEACKENVLPIKRGRNIKDLNNNLEKPLNQNHEKNSLEKIQEAYFENNLKFQVHEEKSEIEILDVFLNYIKWTRDTYPSNSDKTLKLLERCTCELKDFTSIKNDARFIKLWIEYADLVKTPGEVFSFMQTNKIGEKVSLFWIAWAFVAEKVENYKLADQIFQKGIRKLAEPKDIMQKRYQQFQRRMARYFINQEEVNALSQLEATNTTAADSQSLPSRQALGKLSKTQLTSGFRNSSSTTTNGAGVNSRTAINSSNMSSYANQFIRNHPSSSTTYTSSISQASTSSNLPFNTVHRGTNKSNTNALPFTILCDNTDSRAAASSRAAESTHNIHGESALLREHSHTGQWKSVPLESQLIKENKEPVSKWTDGPLLPPAGSRLGNSHFPTASGHTSSTAPPAALQAPPFPIFIDTDCIATTETRNDDIVIEENDHITKRQKQGLSVRRLLEGVEKSMDHGSQTTTSQQQHQSLTSRIVRDPLARHKDVTNNTTTNTTTKSSSPYKSIENENNIKQQQQQQSPNENINLPKKNNNTTTTITTTNTATTTNNKNIDKSSSVLSFPIFIDEPSTTTSTTTLSKNNNTNMLKINNENNNHHLSPIYPLQDNNSSSSRDVKQSSTTSKVKDEEQQLNDILNELGVLDGEDSTINTRLAKHDIDAMFCSPVGVGGGSMSGHNKDVIANSQKLHLPSYAGGSFPIANTSSSNGNNNINNDNGRNTFGGIDLSAIQERSCEQSMFGMLPGTGDKSTCHDMSTYNTNKKANASTSAAIPFQIFQD